ncbi:MAG: DUF2304 domain-containing protein [Syntrophales bacterium]
MTPRLKVIAAFIGIALFVFIIELVRRRRLREEYAWLWLLTGTTIVVLSLWYDVLVSISRLLGDIFPSAALFFLGLIFLLLISLGQSVKISELTDQIKVLSQEIALMKVDKKKKTDSGHRNHDITG